MTQRIIKRPAMSLGKTLLREQRRNTERLIRIETRLCKLAIALGADVSKHK